MADPAASTTLATPTTQAATTPAPPLSATAARARLASMRSEVASLHAAMAALQADLVATTQAHMEDMQQVLAQTMGQLAERAAAAQAAAAGSETSDAPLVGTESSSTAPDAAVPKQ